MTVFLLTDVEGLPGVTDISQVDRDDPAYAVTRRALTDTVNRVALICRRAGVDRLYYLDGHAGGGNIYAEEVDPFAQKKDIRAWQELVRSGGIDCQIEVGGHARAGTVGGFLDHTMNSRSWFRYTLNGGEMGELGIHAAFCGAFAVPVVFFSGDEVSCRQAEETVPGIVTAAVKNAEQRNVCTAYPDAWARLEQGLLRALKEWRTVRPLQITLPTTAELTFYRTDFCEEALSRADATVVRKDARTLTKKIEKIDSYDCLKF